MTAIHHRDTEDTKVAQRKSRIRTTITSRENCRRSLGELRFDQRAQLVGRERFKWHFASIQINCRRTVHAHRVSAFAIQKNTLRDRLSRTIASEFFQVQANLCCVAIKDRTSIECGMPRLLVLVKQIVHLPEFPL